MLIPIGWLFFGVVAIFGDGLPALSFEEYYSHRGAWVRVVRADPLQYRLAVLVDPDRKCHSVGSFYRSQPNIVAAINGGFFSANGSPSGFFKYYNWWSYTSKTRGVFGFNGPGSQGILFDRLTRARPEIVSSFYSNQWWLDSSFIVGGAPLLIKSGQLLDFSDERVLPSFARNRYARSGFCVDRSRKMVFVLVSGGDRVLHKLRYRQGLSLYDFALELQELGCVDAINLDGGYSSSMIFDGELVPGHGMQIFWPRPVANALAFIGR